MNVNDYLARTYGPQPCWEMVADVLVNEAGGAPLEFRTINRSVREMASEFRLALHKGQHGYLQVDAPAELAIVLLGKTAALGVHHCGVWLEGAVLHAMPGLTLHQDLPSIRDQFELVQFWSKAE